jgi:hypothetical protein
MSVENILDSIEADFDLYIPEEMYQLVTLQGLDLSMIRGYTDAEGGTKGVSKGNSLIIIII